MTIPLEPDTIHLLRVDLSDPPVPLDQLERLLSAEERARAARFRFPGLGERYVVTTGLLRTALARVLGASPRSLALSSSEQGKPFLAGGPAFNLSHSGNRLLIGMTPHGHLGVDIEVHRALSNLERLVGRSFSAAEADAILAHPKRDRPAAFFRTWTRKESLVKALGVGLRMPLSAFTVSTDPPGPDLGNALVRVEDPDTFRRSLGDALGHQWAPSSDWWISPVPAYPFDEADDLGPPPVAAAVAWDRPRPPRMVDFPRELLF